MSGEEPQAAGRAHGGADADVGLSALTFQGSVGAGVAGTSSAKSFRLHSVMPLLQEVSIRGLVRSCLVFSYLHYPFSHSYLDSLWRPCSGQYVQALQTKITQHELQALKVPC